MPSRSPDKLSTYREKRSASATPEPFGAPEDNSPTAPNSTGVGQRRLFVVQQHAASHLHYDFRLEIDNVLRSWAVPKGPSGNPEDKRFAALVEDHPLDYANFEGQIPDGNYGAGHVIVWDHGTYVELEDFELGFQKGKLLFQLEGHKLKGRWTLIKLKGKQNTGKEWLLIKERDDYVTEVPYPDHSVFSGLDLNTIKDPIQLEDDLIDRLEELQLPESVSLTEEPMLAKPSEPFHRKDWVFEIKYDGYRLMIEKSGDDVTLRSRNGLDLTSLFPEIELAARRLPYYEFTIDGEIVVHDERGIPSFSLLQQRARLRNDIVIRRAMRHQPVTYYAFDLMHLCGFDLKKLPLVERKSYLEEILPDSGLMRYSAHIDGNGVQVFEAMVALGLEGVVGKRPDSAYVSGRSDHWMKVRARRSAEFVVAGWTPNKSDENDVGAVVVAEYRDDELVFCGRVGSGLGGATRSEVKSRLAELGPGEPLVEGDRYRWVEPLLVCEVEFKEYTRDGSLRHPVFLRFRDDKEPEECISTFVDMNVAVVPIEVKKEVIVTNRDKIFFPEKELTKGDLIDYYEAIAEWMLPYLKDRPLVLTRFPDGIHGKSFYQRDAPAFVPDWVKRKTLWSDSAEREVNYFIVQEVESLRYLANMGAIPIHAWHSRITDLEHPDWCVLDLDPKSAPFKDVVKIAKAIKELLDEIGLPGFLKSSGASGLHVLLPIANKLTHNQSKTLGELLARVIVSRHNDIATITRTVRKRDDKVYIDFMQNGHGQLLVAPFSARAEAAASVSMPLEWTELTSRLSNPKFHLKNAVTRLKRKGDPMAPLLTTDPDLEGALAALGQLMQG